MPEKRSIGILALPGPCCQQMQHLGEHIRLARMRRKIRQDDMAKRICIAVKTYRKIEKGDPAIAIGLYLSALYMLGLHSDFSILASPERDRIGLMHEEMRLPKRVRLAKDKELDF